MKCTKLSQFELEFARCGFIRTPASQNRCLFSCKYMRTSKRWLFMLYRGNVLKDRTFAGICKSQETKIVRDNHVISPPMPIIKTTIQHRFGFSEIMAEAPRSTILPLWLLPLDLVVLASMQHDLVDMSRGHTRMPL
jgi:hypothetical protein